MLSKSTEEGTPSSSTASSICHTW